jgi:hypothetical protein
LPMLQNGNESENLCEKVVAPQLALRNATNYEEKAPTSGLGGLGGEVGACALWGRAGMSDKGFFGLRQLILW